MIAVDLEKPCGANDCGRLGSWGNVYQVGGGLARSGLSSSFRCPSRCCVSLPPKATFRTCMPRQMARTGISAESAYSSTRNSKFIQLGPELQARIGVRLLPVSAGVDIRPAREQETAAPTHQFFRWQYAVGVRKQHPCFRPCRLHRRYVTAGISLAGGGDSDNCHTT